jgi:hypothetical protein
MLNSPVNVKYYQLPITKWPHQSEAPVGAAPTRSQLRLQRQIELMPNSKHAAATSPPPLYIITGLFVLLQTDYNKL